jgi:hypothetical protein
MDDGSRATRFMRFCALSGGDGAGLVPRLWPAGPGANGVSAFSCRQESSGNSQLVTRRIVHSGDAPTTSKEYAVIVAWISNLA